MIFLAMLVFIFLHMSMFWLFYRLLKNPSVVDVGWASVLATTSFLYLVMGNQNMVSFVAGLLVVIWAVRLGGYLWFSRISQGHVDKRYTKLSEDWKISKDVGFYLNFQLQGLLTFFISLSFYFISQRETFLLYDVAGLMMILLGLMGETLADYQLQRFKKCEHQGVCDRGLWRYTRHPNYFFDWLTWLGFSLLAMPASWGILAVISPLTLYVIMVYVTGPMTEMGSLQSRGEAYAEYQCQTPMFFPGLRRNSK